MRRLPMRKISEALRLRAAGLSTRKIAASLSVGQSTIWDYLKRADRAGLSWPLPPGATDADIERRLFAPTGGQTRRGLAQPDWAAVHRELRRMMSDNHLVRHRQPSWPVAPAGGRA